MGSWHLIGEPASGPAIAGIAPAAREYAVAVVERCWRASRSNCRLLDAYRLVVNAFVLGKRNHRRLPERWVDGAGLAVGLEMSR